MQYIYVYTFQVNQWVGGKRLIKMLNNSRKNNVVVIVFWFSVVLVTTVIIIIIVFFSEYLGHDSKIKNSLINHMKKILVLVIFKMKIMKIWNFMGVITLLG